MIISLPVISWGRQICREKKKLLLPRSVCFYRTDNQIGFESQDFFNWIWCFRFIIYAFIKDVVSVLNTFIPSCHNPACSFTELHRQRAEEQRGICLQIFMVVQSYTLPLLNVFLRGCDQKTRVPRFCRIYRYD